MPDFYACVHAYSVCVYVHVCLCPCLCVCVETENGSSFYLITCILNVSGLHSVRRGTDKYSLLLFLSGVCGECSSPTVAPSD